jgi:Fur family peroxide stress response transcriptional regulator
MNTKQLDLKQLLKDHDLKVTRQRVIILQILKESQIHPSAEMIVAELEKKGERFSIGTVYNVLETFCEVGLINRISVENNVQRFDARTDFHIHLCNNTNILDFNDEMVCMKIQQDIYEALSHYGNISKIELKVLFDENIEP